MTFDDKWMPDLKAAMINVVDNGTAPVVRRDDMKIAAKTGTAQVGSKEHPRQIAWLSGYLPADNPQYAFSVMVEGRFSDNRDFTEEGGLLGGREAGAICKGIFDQIYPVPGKEKKVADDSSKKQATIRRLRPETRRRRQAASKKLPTNRPTIDSRRSRMATEPKGKGRDAGATE